MANKKIRPASLIPIFIFISIILFNFGNNFAWAKANASKCQALVQAIENNDKVALQELIDAGADLNQKCEFDASLLNSNTRLLTPLIIAVESGNMEIVEILLSAGALANEPVELAKASIQLKDKNGKNSFYEGRPDNFAYDPLCAAILNDNIELARLLLANGADPNRIYGTSKLHGFGRYYALKFAMLKKNSEMASLLIENGAKDIDSLEEQYHRILSHFIETNAPLTDIERLLQLKINVNSVYMASRWDKPYTLLMTAVENADVATVELLLKYGATFGDLPYYNIDYHSDMVLQQPFYFMAARNPNVEMVRFLKAKGIEPTHRYWHFPNPLYYAAANSNPQVLAELLELGYEPNVSTTYQGTPLHVAAEYADKPESLVLLIKAGAKVNSHTEYTYGETTMGIFGGFTPLMNVVENSDMSSDDKVIAVKLLLEAGAKTHYKNEKGKTVLDLIDSNNPELEQLLTKHYKKDLWAYRLKWVGAIILLALFCFAFYKIIRKAFFSKPGLATIPDINKVIAKSENDSDTSLSNDHTDIPEPALNIIEPANSADNSPAVLISAQNKAVETNDENNVSPEVSQPKSSWARLLEFVIIIIGLYVLNTFASAIYTFGILKEPFYLKQVLNVLVSGVTYFLLPIIPFFWLIFGYFIFAGFCYLIVKASYHNDGTWFLKRNIAPFFIAFSIPLCVTIIIFCIILITGSQFLFDAFIILGIYNIIGVIFQVIAYYIRKPWLLNIFVIIMVLMNAAAYCSIVIDILGMD